MLFLELIPLDCLPLPDMSFSTLKGGRCHTVRAAKQFRQDSFSVMREYWYLIAEDILVAQNAWRAHNADLRLVSVPNDAVPSLPPLTVINFINERTIIQNYTVRFIVPKIGIGDDQELSKLVRLPKAIAALLKDAGCRTMRDVIAAPFELLEEVSGDNALLLRKLVVWFRKKCLIELEPSLKTPFTRIEEPDDIAPLVQLLYDDINAGALVIDYEDIIASLLPFRSYVVDKLKHASFLSSLLNDADLMNMVYSQPSFIEAACKLVGVIIESHKWMGVERLGIDSELPHSMLTVGGSAPFLPLLLEVGVLTNNFGLISQLLEPMMIIPTLPVPRSPSAQLPTPMQPTPTLPTPTLPVPTLPTPTQPTPTQPTSTLPTPRSPLQHRLLLPIRYCTTRLVPR